jgi:hypothetical protein
MFTNDNLQLICEKIFLGRRKSMNFINKLGLLEGLKLGKAMIML